MNEIPEHKVQQARRTAEREARRKAELKANMARRKAQLRGRAVIDEQGADQQGTGKDQPGVVDEPIEIEE
jgi:hypothetical protein